MGSSRRTPISSGNSRELSGTRGVFQAASTNSGAAIARRRKDSDERTRGDMPTAGPWRTTQSLRAEDVASSNAGAGLAPFLSGAAGWGWASLSASSFIQASEIFCNRGDKFRKR